MTIAVFAGSFDPITNGHINILEKSAKIFDKIFVAVAYNKNKQGLIPYSERAHIIQESVKHLTNVQVDCFSGLTVDFAKKHNANILIRGLRNTVDFEYEKQIAQNNQILAPHIQTVFLTADPEYCFISSSGIKELLYHNADISKLVPEPAELYLKNYAIKDLT